MTAPFPQPDKLSGQHVKLRALVPADRPALQAAAADPLIWDQHPTTDRHTPAGFGLWFDKALAEHALIVEDPTTGKTLGTSRYYDWQATTREVAIGHTFLIRDCWGGPCNGEMKQLMLGHAFQHAETVWFHVAVGNHRSRRAMEKIGGVWAHDGILEGLPYHYFRIDRP